MRELFHVDPLNLGEGLGSPGRASPHESAVQEDAASVNPQVTEAEQISVGDNRIPLLERLAPHSVSLGLAWLNLPAVQVPFAGTPPREEHLKALAAAASESE